jgi:hypothetical protein
VTGPAALTWSGVTARRMALADAELTVDELTEAIEATPAGQAGNYPVLLVDGVVGGVWHQRRSGRKLATVEPRRRLTAPQLRQLDEEAGLVGAVMEAAVTLTVGTVTVGAHA